MSLATRMQLVRDEVNSEKLSQVAPSYAIQGVYSDGAVRRHHVTTDYIGNYVKSLFCGIFPFVEVTVEKCDNMVNCDHSSVEREV